MILVLDNYDSFVWNLVQAVGAILREREEAMGEPAGEIRVVRSDSVTVREVERLKPARIILSPGPCTPAEAGVCVDLVRELGGTAPILGVCLGHQAIGAADGARVVRARRAVHGKASTIHHTGAGVFAGLPSPLVAARYHSLTLAAAEIDPQRWEVTECSDEPGGERIVMGVRRRWEAAALEGVQFHPESYMTPGGQRLLANFLLGRGAGPAEPASIASPAVATRAEAVQPETV